jgi:hypothetical protein
LENLPIDTYYIWIEQLNSFRLTKPLKVILTEDAPEVTDIEWTPSKKQIVIGEIVNSLDLVYKKDLFSVFLNPNRGVFRLELKESVPSIHLSIYSTSGKMLFSNNDFNPKNMIKFQPEMDGLYIVRVETGNSVGIEKVLIQK